MKCQHVQRNDRLRKSICMNDQQANLHHGMKELKVILRIKEVSLEDMKRENKCVNCFLP